MLISENFVEILHKNFVGDRGRGANQDLSQVQERPELPLLLSLVILHWITVTKTLTNRSDTTEFNISNINFAFEEIKRQVNSIT